MERGNQDETDFSHTGPEGSMGMLTRTIGLMGLALGLGMLSGPAAAQEWDHAHLVATDTAAAAQWYHEHFGGEITKSGPFDAVLFGSNLVKFRKSDGAGPSAGSAVDHICFSVDDVQAKADELREAGAEVGAPNRKTKSVAIVTDPWGTKIELLKDEDLLGFHHVHLKSRTSATTAEWYATLFGGEVGAYKNVPNLKAIRFGSMYVFVQTAIRAVAPSAGRSIDHLGWRFTDFDATIKRLKGLDVKFVVEPTQSGDHRIAFIESPDGVKIEIVEDIGH